MLLCVEVAQERIELTCDNSSARRSGSEGEKNETLFQRDHLEVDIEKDQAGEDLQELGGGKEHQIRYLTYKPWQGLDAKCMFVFGSFVSGARCGCVS